MKKIIYYIFFISSLSVYSEILAADFYGQVFPQDFVSVKEQTTFEFLVQGDKILKSLSIESGNVPDGMKFDFVPGRGSCNIQTTNLMYCDVLKGILTGTPYKAGVYNFTITALNISGEKSFRNYTIKVLDNNPTYLYPVFPRNNEVFAPGRLLRFKWNTYNPLSKVQSNSVPTYSVTLHKILDKCDNITAGCMDSKVKEYVVTDSAKEINELPWVVPNDFPSDMFGKVRFRVKLNNTDVVVWSSDFYIVARDEFAPPTLILNNFDSGDVIEVDKKYPLDWTVYNIAYSNANTLDFIPLENCKNECGDTIKVVDVLELHRKDLVVNNNFPYRGKGRFVLRSLNGNYHWISPVVSISNTIVTTKNASMDSLQDGVSEWLVDSNQKLSLNIEGYGDEVYLGLFMESSKTGEGLVQYFPYKKGKALDFRVPSYIMRDGKVIMLSDGNYTVKIKVYQKDPCPNNCAFIDTSVKEVALLQPKWPVYITRKISTSGAVVSYNKEDFSVVLGRKLSALIKIKGIVSTDVVSVSSASFSEFVIKKINDNVSEYTIEGVPTNIVNGVLSVLVNGKVVDNISFEVIDPNKIIADGAKDNFINQASYFKISETGQFIRLINKEKWLYVSSRAIPKNEKVLEIPSSVLDYYSPVVYIRLRGTNPVYKIDNGIRRLMTPRSRLADGVNEAQVLTVSKAEFYGLKGGPTYR